MPTVPILMFTIHKASLPLAVALAAGASAVAFKSDGVGELINQAKVLLLDRNSCW
jgi:hypothetical protein